MIVGREGFSLRFVRVCGLHCMVLRHLRYPERQVARERKLGSSISLEFVVRVGVFGRLLLSSLYSYHKHQY
jgi:hypothetical protein